MQFRTIFDLTVLLDRASKEALLSPMKYIKWFLMSPYRAVLEGLIFRMLFIKRAPWLIASTSAWKTVAWCGSLKELCWINSKFLWFESVWYTA